MIIYQELSPNLFEGIRSIAKKSLANNVNMKSLFPIVDHFDRYVLLVLTGGWVSYAVLFLSDLFHAAPTFLEVSSDCRRFWRTTQQFPYESEAGKKTLPNQEPAYEHVKFRLEQDQSCQYIYSSKLNCVKLRYTCLPNETNKINTNKKAKIENTVRTSSCIFHKYTVMTVKESVIQTTCYKAYIWQMQTE